jgi:phospholipase/lecithinase/hemolysin
MYRRLGLGFILLLVGVSAVAGSFKQLVIFGDSYSDNGNTYRASGNTYPGKAYYKGRFSNGPVWPGYLSERLGVATYRNYAYGQAQVSGVVSFDTHAKSKSWRFSVPDLPAEVSQYLAAGNVQPKQTLYFIFIGTNDFLNYEPSTVEKDSQFVQQTVQGLVKQIDRLEKLGANHIVVFNMRDLKLSPLAHQLAAQYKNNYLAKLNRMVRLYNTDLSKRYAGSSTVKLFNIHRFDQDTYYHRLATPCYVNKGDYIDLANPICTDSSDHFFYDRIHLTTSMNQILANSVYNSLANTAGF